MSNNTTLTIKEAGSLILSGPYLLWLEKDVFPYIFGTVCLLALLLGIIFNIALCKQFAKDEHVGIKRTINQLVLVDVFAEVFVLAPGVYISYAKLEDLPDAYCIVNGLSNVAIFLIQFGILSKGVAMSFLSNHPSKCQHLCSIVCICTIPVILAIIPITWEDGYLYVASEFRCSLNRAIKKVYISVIFLMSVFVSLILACVVSVMLVKRFLSKNTKVAEVRHSHSDETVAMEDRAVARDMTAESVSNERRQRFKSDDTVSIEDQTRSCGVMKDGASDHKRDRFRSDVTVSIEDQTKSYEIVPFQSGITVSMEDQTKSYLNSPGRSGVTVSIDDQTHSCKNFEHSEWGRANSDLCSFRRYKDSPINFFRETVSSDSSVSTGICNVKNVMSSNPNTENTLDSENNSDNGSYGSDQYNNNMWTGQHCKRDGDDEISFDGTIGPGILSRAASRSSIATIASISRRSITEPRSTRRSTRSEAGDSVVRFIKTRGTAPTANTNTLSKILQSDIINNSKMLKLATINVIVLFAVLACWSPFVILVYIDMYGTLWWKGWLTVAILCANISYCIKPFIILGLSGKIVQASKAVLPKSVENRTERVALFLNKTADKVGKRIY